ncbi:zinc metalloprotease [Sphaerisporangium sp. TRM90804]|uniref:zinc metalloprotease n=1 Tax=Sphaerisporangium sp. TRM90804 TaxID=3031113 RepID=UPI00244CF6D5|nr:zinc metalloprotease [Sphaerisporangium sp. TRM90804]MDH2430009.1 zinc metalloprotease [Sphaerisporangium sp. TRM90804]
MAVSLVCLFTMAGMPLPVQAGTHACGHAGHPHVGTRPPEPYAPDAGEAARMIAEMERRLRSPGAEARRASVTVPVWVHVITDGHLAPPDTALASQVETLNAAYGGRYGGVDTGIRFVLRGFTRTENSAWFHEPLSNEAAMKQRLRKGGPETLNLYVAQLDQLVLGYATYPHWYQNKPGLDGVVIDWRSLPGGSLRDFAKGFTGVHEIGHWFGLLHTFENGCASPGDFVDDTVPESAPSQGCPVRKDTCPALGEDPFHNYMDYSHDRCMWEFTAGQAVRMRDMWAAYRTSAA